ncbi:probable ascorbate-specific transmembrane electron transporter 1 [Elaeis guineensis]|uniref:Probable ascorbate-specific transmembrane electron transporter 1 n=1 Tax=Elaeis guineensis var. tenera TaxID=51953 RepID=A0A6I9S481_ELAGV|nr:probable ascorbate-specific transmembrane electron transporter 1 [Elaeis guineensis]
MAAKDGSSFRMSALPAIIIAQLLGIAAITLTLVWLLHLREGVALDSGNSQKLFNAHPLLMLLGLILCGGEAIMAYKTVPGTRRTKKFVHMLLHLLALAFGGLGLYAIFKFQRDLDDPDMRTLHSWLGMGTICLYALQWVIAFFSFIFPGTTYSMRANMKPWHAFFGAVIFLMAICSAETGLVQKFIFVGREGLLINFIGITILLYGIFTILSVILPRPYEN